MEQRVDKVRACHRHHRAPRIVFVGNSPTDGRNSCRGGRHNVEVKDNALSEAKGYKPLEGQGSWVGRDLAPPPARMARSPRLSRRRREDTWRHTYPGDPLSLHTTSCVSLGTSSEAFQELSAAAVGGGLLGEAAYSLVIRNGRHLLRRRVSIPLKAGSPLCFSKGKTSPWRQLLRRRVWSPSKAAPLGEIIIFVELHRIGYPMKGGLC